MGIQFEKMMKEEKDITIKAVLFDMDGVIIDSEPLHFEADQKVMERLGHSVEKNYFESFLGISNPDMWAKIKTEFEIKESISELMILQEKLNFELLEHEKIEPIVGIVGLLTELRKQGIKTGIGSSSSSKCIHKVVHKFDLMDAFDVLQSGEEVSKGKPAPDVYLEVARKLEVDPKACVVIEDASSGISAAKAAGMYCIAYKNPNSGNQDLSQADWIVDSIEEISVQRISEWLKEIEA